MSNGGFGISNMETGSLTDRQVRRAIRPGVLCDISVGVPLPREKTCCLATLRGGLSYGSGFEVSLTL